MSDNRSTYSTGELQIEMGREGEVAIVKLSGSAGMEESDELRKRLLEVADQKPRIMILDMGELNFICSVGLGGMVASCLRCWRHKGVVRLVRPKPSIHDMLEKTKLTVLFEVFDSMERAIKV